MTVRRVGVLGACLVALAVISNAEDLGWHSDFTFYADNTEFDHGPCRIGQTILEVRFHWFDGKRVAVRPSPRTPRSPILPDEIPGPRSPASRSSWCLSPGTARARGKTLARRPPECSLPRGEARRRDGEGAHADWRTAGFVNGTVAGRSARNEEERRPRVGVRCTIRAESSERQVSERPAPRRAATLLPAHDQNGSLRVRQIAANEIVSKRFEG